MVNFRFFHKLATHRAIIGHTPKVDLDLLRVEQYYYKQNEYM